MTVKSSMECYASRLASFNASHPSTKKRASDAKGNKTRKWPHKNPSPPELARAGFFYQPTSSGPDNTTCYLCQSNIDAWEAHDDAVVEHLKLSPDCGWAITVAIEQDIENGSYSLEDPMSEKVLNARRMTFGSHWPHESKRGWTCKVQKMIAAGWHYCPTLESDDFVKCSYCSLSLDGWEPKDKPFDEHKRRSPDCSFFTLYAAMKGKSGRSRIGRASKASRMSTQSNVTALSEGTSVAETDANIDESMMSSSETVKPTKPRRGVKKTSKTKKSTSKTKGSGTKGKQEDTQLASSYLEPEDDNFEVKIPPSPVATANGKKRKSDDISKLADDQNILPPNDEKLEPQIPAKKLRRTRASSVQPAQEVPTTASQDDAEVDAQMTDLEEMPPPSVPAPKKRAKGSKKRSSSTTRKVSTASTASKAPLRATMPDDQEIDAALAADLNRPLTDEEGDPEPVDAEEPKGRRLTRTKPGSKKATASVASTRRGTRASSVIVDELPKKTLHQPMTENLNDERNAANEEAPDHARSEELSKNSLKINDHKAKNLRVPQPQQKNQEDDIGRPAMVDAAIDDTKSQEDILYTKPQQPGQRQTSRQIPARNTRASDLPITQDVVELGSGVSNCMLDSQTLQDDSGHESDASVARKTRAKAGTKKTAGAAKKIKGAKRTAPKSRNTEDAVQAPNANLHTNNDSETISVVSDHGDDAEPAMIVAEPLKEQAKVAKAPKAKGKSGKAKAAVPKASPVPTAEQSNSVIEIQDTPTSPVPPPPPIHSTPRPAQSPQSSDAENQPPSSRPSTLRPPLSMHTPSKSQINRVPLAATTPTVSPSKGNSSKLQSTLPWTAVDLERIVHGTPSADKENNPFVSGDSSTDVDSGLTSPEKKLNVEQWIQFNAQRGEEKLRNECERLVGKFEGEGVRALRTLEGIVCAE